MLRLIHLIAIFICWTAPAATAACLSYTDRVTLTGKLVIRTFPGPPNYQDVLRGDDPEVHWLVLLDRPQCVDTHPDPKRSSTMAGYDSFDSVDLVFGCCDAGFELTREQLNRYRPLAGKRVTVSGTLYDAFTAHHRAPLLLQNVEFLTQPGGSARRPR